MICTNVPHMILHLDDSVQKLKDGQERKLLDDVWGEVPEQQTTAIMGPSGALYSSMMRMDFGSSLSRCFFTS